MVDPTHHSRVKSARVIQVPKVQQGGQGQQIPKTPQPSAASAKFTPKQLDPHMFPDPVEPGKKLRTTVANVEYLLLKNGISFRYNVIKKKLEMLIPGIKATVENEANVLMTHAESLAAQHYMNTNSLPKYIYALADRNAYNPVADWINREPWDGIDRLPEFYDTLHTQEDFPIELKRVLMRKWLLSAVAAALSLNRFRSRGVLTLQGPQNIGKTAWGRKLISDPLLRDSVVKTDHQFDGGNKDNFLSAIEHFIVEIGELESSFKRDIARLKGFLTADFDKFRRPYERFDSVYPRRTVFYATVNQPDFLQDNTGNSRWWTLPVIHIDHEHDIDMQQVFAQLAVDYHNGAPWWLSVEEDALLEQQNRRHMSSSVVRDTLAEKVDFERTPTTDDAKFTATELLKFCEIKHPTNSQAKECAAILREHFGESKRTNGHDKWRVPLLDGDWEDEPRSGSNPAPQRPSTKKFD